MTDLRKAAEMALDALHNIDQSNNDDAIQALRQALAQEQERELTDEEIDAHSRKMLDNLNKQMKSITENAVVQAVENMKRDGRFDLPNDIDAYERGVIDGMQKQMKSTVERAVNAMTKHEWVGLTVKEVLELLPSSEWKADVTLIFAKAIETKLKEKNT